MLVRCSEKRDMAEWNEWRGANPRVEIELEGAGLWEAHLEGADLRKAHLDEAELAEAHLEGAILRRAHLNGASLDEAHLEGAMLRYAHLKYANLMSAYLQGADLSGANLELAEFSGAHLEGADLQGAHLEGADLQGAHLEGADLLDAHLEGAKLPACHLERAGLQRAHLQRATLKGVHLEGVRAEYAAVDGSTILTECTFDRKTRFTGVALANARIDPGLRAALEANVRRMQWDEWCAEKPWRRRPWKVFWWISDYGQSMRKILYVFFVLAAIFAVTYLLPGMVRHFRGPGSEWPGEFVSALHSVDREGRAPLRVPAYLVPFRALYFSVVTMTTLGFGDIHAQPDSFVGHLLLTIQVLFGYVLLGSLIARLGILYQSLGPQKDPTPSGESRNRNGKTACEAKE